MLLFRLVFHWKHFELKVFNIQHDSIKLFCCLAAQIYKMVAWGSLTSLPSRGMSGRGPYGSISVLRVGEGNKELNVFGLRKFVRER